MDAELDAAMNDLEKTALGVKAERDALRAQNAELREALQAALRHAYELNELVYSGEHVADDSAVAIIRAALKSCE